MKKSFLLISAIITAFSFFSFQSKKTVDLKASVVRGKEIYNAYCISCHMEQGEGIPSVYPPLAKSDYLKADKKRSITTILKGMTGEIVVNGVTYNAEMTSFDLNDQEVSDVLNYVRNSWGNKGEAVAPEEVAAARK